MFRILSSIITAVVLASIPACSDNHASLVGTWKLTKSEKLPAGATTTWIFNKEGTASTTLVLSGGAEKVYTRKWKIDGNSLSISKAGTPEAYDSATIIKLTDSTLIVKGLAILSGTIKSLGPFGFASTSSTSRFLAKIPMP